ncbi:unnamed protein product [Meloidogyne enterolobii]|uniref:Uncharacterized protein n=1 Tax=Meloidogyne enterolobii TaxID=390850 RepID=A0ACB0ZT78_MELEN
MLHFFEFHRPQFDYIFAFFFNISQFLSFFCNDFNALNFQENILSFPNIFKMNIHLTIFIIFVFSSALLICALEHCDDQHGGYCIEDGSRGCCVHGPPLCCKEGHGDCIPRLGFNYNNTKCEKLECLEGEVCMPLGGEGKDKCVPKDVEVCNNYLIFEKTAKCGDNGYPIGYGLKYCNKFYQYYDSFNDFGKSFVKCVGPCLAEKMSENIEVRKENKCTASKLADFGSSLKRVQDGFIIDF